MSELLILDPSEEAPSRVEIDVTRYVAAQGPDFGEAAIEPFYAEADLGQVPIAHRIPNRIVTIPLIVRAESGLAFDELRSMLQAKVGLWQREGGILKRETSIGPVYADVVNAKLKLGGSTAQAIQEIDVDAVLELECVPDWYGPELDLDTESGTGEVLRVLEPQRGDHPGRVRVIVTDDDGVAQRGCLWCIRSRHYSADPTAALVYEAEDLTPLDVATIATASDASGGASNNVVRHASVGNMWTPVMSTDLDGVGPLTHTGSYRVFARVNSTSAVPPRTRLCWAVGNVVSPTINTPVAIKAGGKFYVVDLGEIRIDPAPAGTHSWQGQVQAAGAAGGENISIDKVWLVALDDFSGTLRTISSVEAGLRDFYARDDFSQTAGNLNGKTATLGGNWTTSGDTGDFQVSGGLLLRSEAADSAIAGRVAVLGSALGPAVARVDAQIATQSATPSLVLRHVDNNNCLLALLDTSSNKISVWLIIAGSVVEQWESPVQPISTGVWYTLQASVDDAGNILVWFATQGAELGAPRIIAQDDDLATGGTLEDGKVGISDFGADAVARLFDNFAAWIPETDAIVHPDRALELRTDGVVREDPAGASFTRVMWVSGDMPRLPPPGVEDRSVDLLVKLTRGDLADLPDASPDDAFSVQVLYRPSYLYVPDGGPGS